MKRYYILIVISLILCVSVTIVQQHRTINKYVSLYEKEHSNVEAYKASNSGLEDEIKEYKMSIDDLECSKDSLDKKILDLTKELKIKNKTIEYLQYQERIIYKVDTICLKDTIFKENISIDTLIKDDWYSVNIKLQYPSNIIVSPTFKSEQYVITNSIKEYNSKPSKIFFIRWFQKKHTAIEINIKEKNPYIKNNKYKFIKITK